ncbi:MAG: FHA domain-containing protein [Anaerolineae bacterium]|nr:FHA domain-containing protein [Anaerolineae bacterium]
MSNNSQPKPTSLLSNKLPLLPKNLAIVPTDRTQAPTAPLNEAIPWRLVLHIGNSVPTAVGIEVIGSLTIGRMDMALGVKPDLDLSPHGAQEAGVSRRHARLFTANNGLYIVDCGSTNGTRVNDFVLRADLPYRLNDGDTIEIGRLRMKLNVIRAS